MLHIVRAIEARGEATYADLEEEVLISRDHLQTAMARNRERMARAGWRVTRRSSGGGRKVAMFLERVARLKAAE